MADQPIDPAAIELPPTRSIDITTAVLHAQAAGPDETSVTTQRAAPGSRRRG